MIQELCWLCRIQTYIGEDSCRWNNLKCSTQNQKEYELSLTEIHITVILFKITAVKQQEMLYAKCYTDFR